MKNKKYEIIFLESKNINKNKIASQINCCISVLKKIFKITDDRLDIIIVSETCESINSKLKEIYKNDNYVIPCVQYNAVFFQEKDKPRVIGINTSGIASGQDIYLFLFHELTHLYQDELKEKNNIKRNFFGKVLDEILAYTVSKNLVKQLKLSINNNSESNFHSFSNILEDKVYWNSSINNISNIFGDVISSFIITDEFLDEKKVSESGILEVLEISKTFQKLIINLREIDKIEMFYKLDVYNGITSLIEEFIVSIWINSYSMKKEEVDRQLKEIKRP